MSDEDEPVKSSKKKPIMLEKFNQNNKQIKKFDVSTLRAYVSSDEDDIPLIALKHKQKDNTVTKKTTNSSQKSIQIMTSTPDLDNSFKDTGLLITPEIKAPTVKRKPAINSKALQVTKDLFPSKPKLNSRKVDRKATSSTTKESWFCFVCDTCAEEDMRLCIVCCRYVHESCVGLTKDDKEKFICPQCS